MDQKGLLGREAVGDERAPAAMGDHQALGLELTQRLADRGAAHAGCAMMNASVIREPGGISPDRMSSRNTLQTCSKNEGGARREVLSPAPSILSADRS